MFFYKPDKSVANSFFSVPDAFAAQSQGGASSATGPPTPLLGGGLEPAFRVLLSAIFHVFPWGISIRVASGGNERNQKCSFFVVNLLTKF
jgi:hypothetical protein